MSGAATVVSAWSPFIVYIAKRSLKTSHLKESERQGADFEACAPGELLPGHARSSMRLCQEAAQCLRGALQLSGLSGGQVLCRSSLRLIHRRLSPSWELFEKDQEMWLFGGHVS